MKIFLRNIKERFSMMTWMILGFSALVFSTSCSEESLPESGSQPDLNPPSAAFVAKQSDTDWMTFEMQNLSDEATDYVWDLGDGTTVTKDDQTSVFHTYAGEGEYTVSLKALDKLLQESVSSQVVLVEEPPTPPAILPNVLESSFEDNSLPDGTGDGRDSWRSDLGGVIQITSSPVFQGSQAAKFPKEGDRVGYQELQVSPNTDYIISYYYTMKEEAGGNMTVTILNKGISDLSEVADATLVANVGTDNTDSDTYVKVSLPFNTGLTGKIAILMTNEVVESRVDVFSIELVAPAP